DQDTRGRDRVVGAHNALFGAFEQRSFALSRVLRTDRSQSLEWTFSGVDSRVQKPVAVKGVTLLWTNDDGSLSDVHLYFDPALVKAQLGVGPPELQTLPRPPISSGAPQVLEQGGTPEETANVALVRAMLKALEDNRESAFLSTLANDVEVF